MRGKVREEVHVPQSCVRDPSDECVDRNHESRSTFSQSDLREASLSFLYVLSEQSESLLIIFRLTLWAGHGGVSVQARSSAQLLHDPGAVVGGLTCAVSLFHPADTAGQVWLAVHCAFMIVLYFGAYTTLGW